MRKTSIFEKLDLVNKRESDFWKISAWEQMEFVMGGRKKMVPRISFTKQIMKMAGLEASWHYL